MVPFDAPMLYGIGGQIYFPWFSFWRRNPLSKEKLALFVTLAEEMLLQDPDLEQVDSDPEFSSPKPDKPRVLTIIDARDIPRVDEERKLHMLETFADGYFQALAALAGMAEKKSAAEDQDSRPNSDPDQPGLFD